MPRKNAPNLLSQITTKTICENIELICYGVRRGTTEYSDLIEKSQYLNLSPSSSVLSDLPGSLLKTILVNLSDQACLKHILHALIQPQLIQIQLSPRIQIITALRTIRERCQKLQSLEIAYCKIPDPGYLVEFFQTFKHLEILNLRSTSVDDLALQQIGKTCQFLKSLDVSNTGVSDNGIQFLPMSLRSLNIVSTGVIPFGVYQFIRTHPNIMKIEYENFYEVCRCIQVMNEATGDKEFKHCLRELNFVGCSGNYDQILTTALTAFHQLESVSIRRSDLSRSALSSIADCAHIHKLELGNSNFSQYTIYFVEHVVPVLEVLGNRLSYLSLEKFKFVDVSSIVERCPKLQKLTLSRILSFCNFESNKSEKKRLYYLRELEILNTLGSRITSYLLGYILKAASGVLRNLTLQFVPSFNEELWTHLDPGTAFENLQVLRLEQCHEVTAGHLLELVSLLPQLELLICYSCSHIAEEEREVIAERIREENYDLIFKWYSSRMVPIPLDLEDWILEMEDREDLN